MHQVVGILRVILEFCLPYETGGVRLEDLLKVRGLADLSLGEGNGTPLQYSCLENLMDGGAW